MYVDDHLCKINVCKTLKCLIHKSTYSWGIKNQIKIKRGKRDKNYVGIPRFPHRTRLTKKIRKLFDSNLMKGSERVKKLKRHVLFFFIIVTRKRLFIYNHQKNHYSINKTITFKIRIKGIAIAFKSTQSTQND